MSGVDGCWNIESKAGLLSAYYPRCCSGMWFGRVGDSGPVDGSFRNDSSLGRRISRALYGGFYASYDGGVRAESYRPSISLYPLHEHCSVGRASLSTMVVETGSKS